MQNQKREVVKEVDPGGALLLVIAAIISMLAILFAASFIVGYGLAAGVQSAVGR
jgi:hypothetical protein